MALMQALMGPLLQAWGRMLAALPGSVRLALGNTLGRGLGVFGFRKKVILKNLEICFPQESPADRRLRVRAAYCHLGNLVLEVVMVFAGLKSFALKKSELKGVQHWKQASAVGKGAIFLASHAGNWEIMAATGVQHGPMDLMLVTKHLQPEWLHQLFEKGRTAAGVKATYEPRTMRDILKQLKRGGTVGIVLDQYTGPPVGIRVPFFGVCVGTHTLIALLARRTGAPVLPVSNRRLEDGTFVVEIEAPLTWISATGAKGDDAQEELELNTERYAQVMERMVRENANQWLWTHRRFKGNLGPITAEERLASRRHRQS